MRSYVFLINDKIYIRLKAFGAYNQSEVNLGPIHWLESKTARELPFASSLGKL